MACSWVGPRGAVAGAVGGALVTSVVSLGTQAAAASGLRAMPLNFTMQCPNEVANIDLDFVSNI